MRLYIIRHADPDYPNRTITDKGHLEAQALAKRLASQGLDRIYSSPLGRAIHTAQYTADTLKMDYQICLLYTSPSPRDNTQYPMPYSA